LQNVLLAKMLDLLVPPPESADGMDRGVYERFALPHVFKPRLSLYEACVAVAAGLARIFLGSLIFAVWGSYSWKVWTIIPNTVLRVIVLLSMLLMFLLFFAMAMISITAMARAVTRKNFHKSYSS
jgi:hypothetical protein